MEARPRQIENYITPQGKEPFAEWADSLKDKTDRARIRAHINRLEAGNFGDCTTIGGGLWELRLFFGPGYRVYFGRSGGILVILLCGGDKSSQKKDIERARRYWEDYKKR